jgi:hypothetical protein
VSFPFDFKKNGMVRAWHGRGMANVNQTQPYCVYQMGKTHSKTLAGQHGRGTAWARHAMCESAFNVLINHDTKLHTIKPKSAAEI